MQNFFLYKIAYTLQVNEFFTLETHNQNFTCCVSVICTFHRNIILFKSVLKDAYFMKNMIVEPQPLYTYSVHVIITHSMF